jgi:hypothetical protein
VWHGICTSIQTRPREALGKFAYGRLSRASGGCQRRSDGHSDRRQGLAIKEVIFYGGEEEGCEEEGHQEEGHQEEEVVQ